MRDTELVVDKKVISWAAGVGAGGGDGVRDLRDNPPPVNDCLATGSDGEVDGAGAEDMVQLRDGRRRGAVEERVTAGDDVGTFFDSCFTVDLEQFLHPVVS